MPCNLCGEDSGKFYGGSCPECLVKRVRELEQRVVDLRDVLKWCGGSPSFVPEGEARKGWVKLVEPLLDGDNQTVQLPRIIRIAAAPAMYEALKRLAPADHLITEKMPNGESVNLVTTVGALRQAIIALKKAEGGEGER